MRLLRYVAACLLCSLALVLPYRARALYLSFLAAAVHAPYAWFGRLSRRILDSLRVSNPYDRLDYRD